MNYKIRWLLSPALIAMLIGSAIAGDHQHQHGTVAKGTVESAKTEAKAAAEYPIDHCVVSGERLGSMGDPVVKVYDGREVRFCCNACVPTFEKSKAKYTKVLDDAIIAAQRPTYPLNTCVVSGEELESKMGDPVDYVYQNRLVRLCCNNCINILKKNPDKYLSKLDQASVKATEGESGEEGHK